MKDLAQLRIDLAHARDEARRAKDHYETMRAICELQIPTSGKNAEDRKRELTVGLAQRPDYQRALDELREAEAAVDRTQALIEIEEDTRREREWRIREWLADALTGQAEDAAFEQATDRALYQGASAAYASRPRGPDGSAANLDDLYPPKTFTLPEGKLPL